MIEVKGSLKFIDFYREDKIDDTGLIDIKIKMNECLEIR